MIALANDSGLVTESYAYSAFGKTVTSGSATAAYRYTGRRYDEETGLYFYRARAYSASLGRFLQLRNFITQTGPIFSGRVIPQGLQEWREDDRHRPLRCQKASI